MSWPAMDLVQAGQRALDMAIALWKADIRDFKASRHDEQAERWRDDITLMIQSELGLDWYWEEPYAGDGDFEWCGAFVARCWAAAGLRLDLRRTFFASTIRLDRFGSYRPWNQVKNPRPATGPVRMMISLDETFLPGSPLLFPDGSEPRSGDILLVGGEGTGPGKHICLVESFDPRSSTFSTIEGNAWGLGPTVVSRQGVIRSRRLAGLRHGQARTTYHARRLIRPCLADLDIQPPAPIAA